MIVAGQDTLTPHEVAISGFESVSDPKKLVILPCSHFEAYTAGFEQGAGAAVDWFRDHLA